MTTPRTTSGSLLINRLRGGAGTGERIFPISQRQLSPAAAADICDLRLDGTACNRRALALLPMPANQSDHEIVETDTLRLQNLLLSIESKSLSCCIRVFSTNQKTRSALLIYKGRLIGSVFGSPEQSNQLFGKAAFEKIMNTLLTPGNVVDAYRLSDELVLSSASLFHGGIAAVSKRGNAEQTFTKNAHEMIANKRTGSLACVLNGDSVVCSTYFFQGQIIGVYSVAEGWLTQTQTAALNSIEANPEVEICSSILRVEPDAAECLTESLTGLDSAPQAK